MCVCVYVFLVSLVVFFLFLVFWFSGKVVAVKAKSSIFAHYQKRSEAIGNFGNFRKQNLSESSEGPHSEQI